MSYSPSVGASNLYPDLHKNKFDYLKENFQSSHKFIKFKKVALYNEFFERNNDLWKKLPDYTKTIVRNLKGSVIPFSQQEMNSRRLRRLSQSHIKIQVGFRSVWVHRSDRYIKLQDVIDHSDDEETACAKDYFYNATIHYSAYENTRIGKIREQIKNEMFSRMNIVFSETVSHTRSPKRNIRTFFIELWRNTYDGIYEIAQMISVGVRYIFESAKK